MYDSSITREHRTAFIILLDYSGSMSGRMEYDGQNLTLAEIVAGVTNQIIGELIERARRHDGVRDYYDIAILGYSDDSVRSVLSTDDEHPFVSISELSQREVKMRSRVVNRVTPDGVYAPYCINEPMWVEPYFGGETPMYRAFSTAYDLLKRWCADPANADSFPPIVFNITDGESTDCTDEDLINISKKIRSLGTNDGEVFVINIHLASLPGIGSLLFPTLKEVAQYPYKKAQTLSRASSIMPKIYDEMIGEIRGVVGQSDFVGVSYNASVEELITILNIGTISIKRG